MRSPLCTEELTCFISIHIMYFKLHRELCLTCACTMECTVYHACFSDAVILRGWSLSAEKGGVLGPLNWRFVKSWRRICMMQLLIDTWLHVILPHHGFNIFLGISAWSGSASASLLKETGEVWNQGRVRRVLRPGLTFCMMPLRQLLYVIGDKSCILVRDLLYKSYWTV